MQDKHLKARSCSSRDGSIVVAKGIAREGGREAKRTVSHKPPYLEHKCSYSLILRCCGALLLSVECATILRDGSYRKLK